MTIKLSNREEAGKQIKKIQDRYKEFSREEAIKYGIKRGYLIDDRRGGGSSGGGSRSVDKDTFDIFKETCATVMTKSEHFKDGFRSALMAAQANIMKNNQDQLFFETANLVTNKPQGSLITKVQLRNNLTQFVFGDKDQKVSRTGVRDSGKFKQIIYLTIITQKRLLTGARTQETTFEKIKDYANLKSNILSALSLFKGKVKCKNVSVQRKGIKKLLGSKKERECTQEQWSSIYLTFPETALKKAIEALVFDEG